MNMALLVITLVSVATTAAVLAYTMRLVRQERERSEARVMALSDAIAERVPQAARDAATSVSTEPPPYQAWLPRGAEKTRSHANEGRLAHGRADDAADALSSGPDVKGRSRTLEGVPVDIADQRIVPGEPFDNLEPTPPLLFGSGTDDTSRRRNWVVPLAGAVVVLALIGGVYATSSRSSAGSAAPAAAAKAGSGSLELISLRHVRTGNGLTISGLVRNPRDGKRQGHVTAVVFLFDRAGSFIASGRAPLDYQQLAAGDESPFIVAVPNAGAVARYRVSFRTESGVVPHVDRRTGIGN